MLEMSRNHVPESLTDSEVSICSILRLIGDDIALSSSLQLGRQRSIAIVWHMEEDGVKSIGLLPRDPCRFELKDILLRCWRLVVLASAVPGLRLFIAPREMLEICIGRVRNSHRNVDQVAFCKGI